MIMRNKWMGRLAFVGITAAVAAGGLVRAQDDVAPDKAIGSVQQLLQAATAQDKAKAVLAIANELVFDMPPSDYWLGVQVAAVPEVAKKQLAIEDGLAVE